MDQLTPVKDQAAANKAAEQRRRAPRQRVLKTARILLSEKTTLDCQVRDVSETGAKLRIPNAASLPKTFRLVTLADNTIRDVEITWKTQDMVGIVFRSAPKPCVLRKV
jgi:hypothetical protein